MKYALEVAKTKSISRAAENLYMGQPNLSRAIKELEEDLGIVIFDRTSKGITVTPVGEEFLHYARKILAQVDEVEAIYKTGNKKVQKFSVCTPRASYISYAFTQFAKHVDTLLPAEIFYKETNSQRTINNVLREEYNLGIVRYQTAFDEYFKRFFREKRLVHETITEFSYVLLTSQNSPLAQKDDILPEDLEAYTEITHADPYVPSLPLVDVKKAELSKFVDKHIFVFERGSQFDLLESVPTTFMWVSPIPTVLLARHNLVQRKCSANNKVYKDVLIYRKNYALTELDKRFVNEVCEAKRKFL